MPLAPQAQIGPYRIVERIATGGMGDVYRGSHTSLERPVAIKVIRETTLDDPVAVKRFSREARLASTLDHPNICHVYDYLEHEDQPLLVLEYCEGRTLAERLESGPLSIEETVQIGKDLASALAHAHSHGVIHRDLKPSNIMLTDSGAKILDFGLVKRTDGGELSRDDESTEPITDEDSRPGTLPYMAPEQVRGETEDERSDIYALGVILFEMISGRVPFERRTNAALAAAILHDSPPSLQLIVPGVSPILAHAVGRCMAADPDDRYESARGVAGELKWLTSSQGELPSATTRRRWIPGALWSGAVVLVVIALLALLIGVGGDDEDTPMALTLLALPGASFIDNHQESVVSPDGQTVLFSGIDSDGRHQLWRRPLRSPTFVRIPSAHDSHTPFWSPDGESVGYFRLTSLMKADVAGGPEELVATVSLESRGATWGNDGVILYAPDPTSGLYRVGPGQPAERVTTPDGEQREIGHLWPSFLPDGEHFLYLVTSPADSVRGIYLASLGSPVGQRVVGSESSALYANGHLLFVREGILLAQSLDPSTGVLSGSPVQLAAAVAVTQTRQTIFSASTAGVITYSSADRKDITELVWRDTSGESGSRVGRPRRHRNPVLSGDAGLLAVEIYEGATGDLWWFDLRTDRSSRTNHRSLEPINPVWSPEGERLVFASTRPDGWGLFEWHRNTTSEPTLMVSSETQLMPTDWSPDGRFIVYADRTERGDYDLAVLDTSSDSTAVLLNSADEEFGGRWSPSGRYLAYVSDRAGTFEIFVEPFPSTGRRCQISSGGGWDPVWGSSDERLYYLTEESTLMAAVLDPALACPIEPPRALFDAGMETPRRSRNHYAFDAARQRFLINAEYDDPREEMIEVLVNWPASIEAAGDPAPNQE